MEKLIVELSEKIHKEVSSKKTWIPGKNLVNYAGQYFDSDEYKALLQTLSTGWLALGENGLKFERIFPKYFGKEYGSLVNSGSSANLLMMTSLTSKSGYNLPKGTKVITPIAGFPTTINPIFQNNFEPVFIDIELNTLNLDLTKLEDVIKESRARVITFAHVLGNPPNMDIVMSLVDKYNLILLEDCCDALGSTYDGKYLGSFGEMASCSFYPAHHISCGEGGFISTKNKELDNIVKSFREWGKNCYCSGSKANNLKCGLCKNRFSNWLPAFENEVFDHKYVYGEIGYNLKPLDIQAAMLIEQEKKLPIITELRKRNYSLLFKLYEKYEEFFILPRATEKSDPNWFAFPLTLKSNAPFKRNDIVEFFESNLIQTRPYFAGNILLQPAYSHLIDINDIKVKYPNATYCSTHTFFHGTSPVITEEQIEYIGGVLDKFMGRYL